MNTFNELVSEAITDFGKVAALAKAEFAVDSMTIEIATKPHKPTALPADKVAVYCCPTHDDAPNRKSASRVR